MVERYCGTCGAELVPLFTSLVCPGECDLRARRGAYEITDADVDALWDDSLWDDKTPVLPHLCPHPTGRAYIYDGHRWCRDCGALL